MKSEKLNNNKDDTDQFVDKEQTRLIVATTIIASAIAMWAVGPDKISAHFHNNVFILALVNVFYLAITLSAIDAFLFLLATGSALRYRPRVKVLPSFVRIDIRRHRKVFFDMSILTYGIVIFGFITFLVAALLGTLVAQLLARLLIDVIK